MTYKRPSERYVISIDATIDSDDKLFSHVTDIAFLGYNSFSGWDAFIEMFDDRLEFSEIEIVIENHDLSGLAESDRVIWLDVLRDLQNRYAQKLMIIPPIDLYQHTIIQ